jgi:hypothetical protein
VHQTISSSASPPTLPRPGWCSVLMFTVQRKRGFIIPIPPSFVPALRTVWCQATNVSVGSDSTYSQVSTKSLRPRYLPAGPDLPPPYTLSWPGNKATEVPYCALVDATSTGTDKQDDTRRETFGCNLTASHWTIAIHSPTAIIQSHIATSVGHPLFCSTHQHSCTHTPWQEPDT